ncbi:MAG: HAMP domain-containing protein [Azoarcus sp.]|jgi:signal transduction histidine kinase/cell division protein FtsB|nr:HAMP domain-containing protein [Azoarcus sp.]
MTVPTSPEKSVDHQARWRHWLSVSVSRRLTLGLIVALLVSAAVVIALGLIVGHDVLRQQQEDAASSVAQLFETSLQNAMLKRDLDGLADILSYLGHAPGVARARLLSPGGEVRFDSHLGSGPLGGKRITLTGEVWRQQYSNNAESPQDGNSPPEAPSSVSAQQLCTGANCREWLHWSTDSTGESLQIVHPILNQARCGQCHGDAAQHPVNGLLMIDFQPRSAAGLERGSAVLMATVVLGALALFALIMLLTLRRQVSEPLASLAKAADRLALGELDTRIQSRSRDELGRVAHAFDRMASRLSDMVVSLRRERQFLQHLVDGMPDPVVVVGSDYRIRLANQAYATLLGHELPAIIGQPCHRISCGLAEPCPSTLLTCPVAEIGQCAHTVSSMMSLKRRDGSAVDVDIDAAPLAQDGGEQLVIEVIRPLERTLRFSQQQRLSTIGLLANGVAHEIHNPLASIRIALQASLRSLRSGQMKREELTDYLELVDHEVDRCVLTTQRLMQMSQTPTQALQPVGVATAIDDVLALLREECRIRGVMVNVDGVSQALRVMGDEAELRQVLVNLVHNALHAMPKGGRIDIGGTSSSDGQRFHLSVRDTGCGIAAEDLPLIFMPFFSRRADGQRGTGLGLAISKAIMDRFGGRIEVSSTSRHGSNLSLTLRCSLDAVPVLTDNAEYAFRTPVD